MQLLAETSPYLPAGSQADISPGLSQQGCLCVSVASPPAHTGTVEEKSRIYALTQMGGNYEAEMYLADLGSKSLCGSIFL